MGRVSDAFWPQHQSSIVGPYENAGDLYVVLRSGNSLLRVYKSIDDGDTWTQAAEWTGRTANGHASFQDGTELVLALMDSSLGSVFTRTFDMATDTLGTESAAGPAFVDNVAGSVPLYVARRANGDTVVFGNGPGEMIMGTAYRRLQVAVWDGASWSTFDYTNGLTFQAGFEFNYDARMAVLGTNVAAGSQRVHIISTRDQLANLQQRAWREDNTVGAEGGFGSGSATTGHPVGYTDRENVTTDPFVTVLTGSGSGIRESAATADSGVPTWSDDLIQSVVNPQVTNSNPGAIALDPADPTTRHAVYYVEKTSTFDVRRAVWDEAGGAWGDQQVFIADRNNALGIACRILSIGLGVLDTDLDGGGNHEVTFTLLSLGPGNQTIAVGTASEVEAANTIGAVADQTIAVGATSETEVAQAVLASASVIVGAASEVEAANTVAVQASTVVTVGVTAEVEAAAAVTALAHQTIAVGGTTETEVAQAVGLVVAVGAVAEAEAAQAIVARGGQTAAVGVVSEVEAADAVSTVFDQTVTVGSAAEIEAANVVAVAAAATVTVGGAIETETAEVVGARTGTNVAVGGATEVEAVGVVGVDRTVPVGVATEVDAAGVIGVALSVGAATETETARPVLARGGDSEPVGGVIETEAARAVAALFDQSVTVGTAAEVDAANAAAVATTVTVAVADATEVELARAVGAISLVRVGVAGEVETARGVVANATATVPVGGALELETVSVAGLVFDQLIGVGFVAEVEAAVTMQGIAEDPVLIIVIEAAVSGTDLVNASSAGTTIPARWPEQ